MPSPQHLAWTHAADAVAEHVDPDAALEAVLDAVVATCGAAGAAVLDAEDVVRARAGETEAAEAVTEPARHPLAVRGVPAGTLVLYRRAGAEAPPAGPAVGILTALASLLLEHDRAYEEARLARQEREHFLVALNHELRTPATALVLLSDMLRDGSWGALPPRLEEMLEKAESLVMDVIGVVEGLRELGRLHDTGRTARSDLVDVRQLAGELLRRVEPLARRKGLRLSLHYPPDLPLLQTDGPRVARVLLHLLGNAIRFTDEGGIDVRLERVTSTGRESRRSVLQVAVRDTGPGIPSGELLRVLEPFAQVQEGSRSASRERGLGLGLPLALRTARSLGGDLTLESRPGQGTTAVLRLPYKRVD